MELKMEQSAGTKYAFKYIGAPENLQKLRKEASDPIEEENVYVASSEIPEGGEGLFAKKVIGTFLQNRQLSSIKYIYLPYIIFTHFRSRICHRNIFRSNGKSDGRLSEKYEPSSKGTSS